MNRKAFLYGVTSLVAMAAPAVIAGMTANAEERVLAQQSAGQSQDCNARFSEPITTIKITARHNSLVNTRDGCWIFTGYAERQGTPETGVGVLRRKGDTFEEVHFVRVPGVPQQPFGLALTHDQEVLVASHARQVSFFDVQKLTSGQADALLGQVSGPRIQYSFGVSITPDDRYAFVAQGALGSVAVIDVEKGRASGFDPSVLVGVIPSVYRPTITKLSQDGRYLYLATKQPPDVSTPSLTCAGGKQPEGAVQIVDAQRARSEGNSATVDFALRAGCEPTTVNLSPNGARLSVLAPGTPDILSSQPAPSIPALVMFELRDGVSPTLVGKVPLPATPGGFVDIGTRIVVGLIGAELAVIDPAKVSLGAAAIVGRLPVAAPILVLGQDGHTLLGLAGPKSPTGPGLVVIDLDRAPVQPTTK